MAHHVIKFEGIYELQKALKENVTLDHVKRVVKQNGAEMTEKAVRNADFKKGYQTGETKGSIPTTLTFPDDGMSAEVSAGTEYHAYVELGTRLMDAQPFLKPAWEEQCKIFKKDMDKLVR